MSSGQKLVRMMWLLPAIALFSLSQSYGADAGQQAVSRGAGSSPSSSAAFAREARISRSISIWRWFNRPEPEQIDHYVNYISDAELATIRKWGFTAIRLPVGTPFLFKDAASYGRLQPDRLKLLRAAIDRINAAGLAVIVDYHPRNDVKKQLESDPQMVARTVDFWRQFAAFLSSTDPNKVMLELLNEPNFGNDTAGWNDVAAQFAAAARQGAPRHTLLVSSAYYGSLEKLPELRPVPDSNVIYTVHMYEPMTFTSQGAAFLPGLGGLTWPSTSPDCATEMEKRIGSPSWMSRAGALVGQKRDPAVRGQQYCASRWDEAKMDRQIADAAAWARAKNVPLWVGEFGVRAQDAPRPDRLRWLRAAVRAFSAQGLGWSLWSYDDCFGLSAKQICPTTLGPSQSISDFVRDTLAAIGMNDPQAVR